MMSLSARLATAACLLVLFLSPAAAQSESPAPAEPTGAPLAGATVMQLSVAPLSAESQRCGLQADLIRDSFQQPLAAEGIGIQASAHLRIVVKATTVVYQETVCISNIEATALQTTRYFDRKTQAERAGQVLLWSGSSLYVSGEHDHVVLTNIGYRDLARAFLRKWKSNQ